MSFAGTPPTAHSGSTSFVTTAPAATVDPRPIRTPGRTIAPAPIQQSSSMTIGKAKEVPKASWRAFHWLSCVPVQMQTSGPMRTRSPMVTGALS
ncbi:hypothetical protein B0I35DRAFT_439582 [Stachybotrys elegans]|uniref:Uncharacterized protein n=1 Tax=Stachybotrys elegans TaxID=80388 RepID=A0A8K0SNL9_9HYPO|nr:hypothetical protein B0I35DRAFT_439582 [Stachybotrys elegans]